MNTWSMSEKSPNPPAGWFKISDVAVVTLTSAGAVRFAPRALDCWIAREQIAVRSNTGELLWVEDTDPDSIDPDSPGGLIELPVPEALAIRDLFSVCGWLGLEMASLGDGTPGEFLDRPARWYKTAAMQYRNISIVEDEETGLIVEVRTTSTEHGEMHLEVVRFGIVPWSAALFAS